MFDSVHMQGHVNLNEAAAFEFHSFKVKKKSFYFLLKKRMLR